MNSATFHIKILSAPVVRYAADNQRPIAEATGEALDQTGEKSFPLRLIVFGQKAEEFASDVEQGDRIIVEGVVNINSIDRTEGFKEKSAQLVVAAYQPAEIDIQLNRLSLVGRAGRDPEVRYFESGSMLATVAIAVNRSKADVPPDWFDLEIWGRTAEIAGSYVRKGSLIGVTGSLKIDSWSDRTTGADRSKPLVKVDRLNLLGSRKDNDQPAEDEPVAVAAAAATRRSKAEATAKPAIDWENEEIPF